MYAAHSRRARQPRAWRGSSAGSLPRACAGTFIGTHARQQPHTPACGRHACRPAHLGRPRELAGARKPCAAPRRARGGGPGARTGKASFSSRWSCAQTSILSRPGSRGSFSCARRPRAGPSACSEPYPTLRPHARGAPALGRAAQARRPLGALPYPAPIAPTARRGCVSPGAETVPARRRPQAPARRRPAAAPDSHACPSSGAQTEVAPPRPAGRGARRSRGAPHLALAVQDGRVELARRLLPLRDVHQVRDRAAARVLECQQRHRPLCAPHKAPEALLLNLLQIRGKVSLEI